MRIVTLLATAISIAVTIMGLPVLALQKEGSKPERKPQSEMAGKVAFATIPATSPDLKKALDSHDLAAAKKLVGHAGAIQGTVAKVFTPSSNALVILNFDKVYKKALVAVVKAEDFARFPNLETLKDKHVLVHGKFVDYNGTPELSLTDASQVKIVK
jgi:hypothetical protein